MQDTNENNILNRTDININTVVEPVLKWEKLSDDATNHNGEKVGSVYGLFVDGIMVAHYGYHLSGYSLVILCYKSDLPHTRFTVRTIKDARRIAERDYLQEHKESIYLEQMLRTGR